jgi:hypothetical protein
MGSSVTRSLLSWDYQKKQEQTKTCKQLLQKTPGTATKFMGLMAGGAWHLSSPIILSNI